ncbi:hypothetical protein ACXJY6_02025 [Vibrio sp. RC27]
MKVQHIIDDLQSVFSKQPETKNYDVAFACYSEDGSGCIEIDYVEAFDWDEDEEFFLIPENCAKYYDREAVKYKAAHFVEELKKIKIENFSEFETYVRKRIKVAKDGSVISINSPMWGTGVHDTEKFVYFYHGKESA